MTLIDHILAIAHHKPKQFRDMVASEGARLIARRNAKPICVVLLND